MAERIIIATGARADPFNDVPTVLHGGATCLETDDGDTSYAEVFHSTGSSWPDVAGNATFDLADPLTDVQAITAAKLRIVARQLTGTAGNALLSGDVADSGGTMYAWPALGWPVLTGTYATYEHALSRLPSLADLRTPGAVTGAAGSVSAPTGTNIAVTYVALVLTVTELAGVRQRQIPGGVRQRQIPGTVRQRQR